MAMLTTSTIIVMTMMAWTGLTIDFLKASNAAYLVILAVLAIIRIALGNTKSRGQMVVRDFSEYLGLFIFLSLLGATATYPAAAMTTGFVDAELARMDSLLFFNWNDWYIFVSAHPVLQQAGRLAYANIYLSPALLLGAFAMADERAKAQLFLVTFLLAATITLALFFAFPAVGPLSYLWQEPIAYMPTSGVYQAQLLPLLRGNMLGEIDLGALQGLVCAPSFHTAAAIIYIVMAWEHRQLRWPLLALNIAMLLSTPIEGTHYLVDMIGGAAVALLALAIVITLQQKISGWRENHWKAQAI
ncbi:phosphatase PAP2 family protein [Parasphingorhabdus halotolerans]|nr:phosphatase PAP2 family protein [Parasphingorhabdus halotolerans]